MFKRALLTTMAVVATCTFVAQADSKDDITAAAKALADAPNYSWTTTTTGGFGNAAPVNGKTEKEGFTTYNIPARQASYDVVKKGDKIAIKMPEGWTTAADMEKAPAPEGGFNANTMALTRVRAFKEPAAQVTDAAGKLENIKKTDTGYTADLTTDAAKELLTFRRPGAAAPGAAAAPAGAPAFEVKDPKGTVALTIKDGMISKIEMHMTGSMSFNGNDNAIDRTSTTEIKDVGTTKVEVPDEAKAKLAG